MKIRISLVILNFTILCKVQDQTLFRLLITEITTYNRSLVK